MMMPATMKKRLNAITVASLALAVGISAAAPANAVSVQNYNNYDRMTQSASVIISVKNEVYRNLLLGQTAQASCINDNFLPRDNVTNGFDDILEDSAAAPNPATQSMESFIVRDIKEKCGSNTAQNTGTSTLIPQFTPLNEFFKLVPDLLSEARIINMALGTQALRAKNAGNEAYSQCILNKLVLPKDATTPPDAFSELFSQLVAHKTATAPLEQILAGAVMKNCGVEPQAAVKPAQ
ncbi:MAG: hypothetical protein WBA42_18105 [Mesorhizobium sp.]